MGPPGGTIRRLEDRDGDGRMDRSVLFAEGVPFPSGVLAWRDGVLVTCAYEAILLRDTDGDGKADVRQTLFSGFGRANSQHLPNAPTFGLDNWIYIANGLSGFSPQGGPLRRSDLRLVPETGRTEAVSGSSQYGQAFDEWGRRFIVRHDNHILFPVIPHEALEGAPHVLVASVEDSISDHGAVPRLFPISPRDWAFTTDTDSSCGIAFWRGRFYVCEPVLNLVHEDEVLPRGASFRARRTRPDAEFLASTDSWFRPVFLTVGPDAALYVADLYRAVIEHPDYIPKEIRGKLDFGAGKGLGRIYRVRPRGPRSVRTFHGRSTAEIAGALEDENPWVRATAQRLLIERRDPAALAALRALASGRASSRARLHALCALEGLGALGAEEIRAALGDPEPGVRENAL